MDYDVKLLAAAKIVLNDLGRQILVNQHPQNIVAEARRKNRTQLDELLYTPSTFDFKAADNLGNEDLKKQIEDTLSQNPKMPDIVEIEGCSEPPFMENRAGSKYSTFMAEQLGIAISSHSSELIEKVKNYVKDLNDHVRFQDSGPISTKAKNKRRPEVLASYIQSIEASAMGVQQQQETAADGIAPAQYGPNMETAAGVNGDATVTAAAAGAPLPPPRRESQQPLRLRDTVLLGANAGARIRSDATAAVRTSSFKLEQLYNRECTDIGRFPSLLALLPQIENQCDLATQLCLILYTELAAAMEEIQKLELMVQDFNRAAPTVLEASNALMFQLVRYKDTMINALDIGGDIQGTAGGAPAAIAWASISAGGVNPGENPAEGELQPSSLPPPTPLGWFLELRGNGYFGGITTIHRIDIAKTGYDGISGIAKNKRENVEVSLPLGSYFLLNQLFYFFGAGINLSNEPYSTWEKWKNRNSKIGKLCYSVESSALVALAGGEQMKVSAGIGGKVLLMPASVVKDFFNTHVVKYFQTQQPVVAAEEGMLQDTGAGGAENEDREEALAEAEREDMQLENMDTTLDELHDSSDPVFNPPTGCLAWAMVDVDFAEATSDRELAQQNDDAMDGSTITTHSQDDGSDIESHNSEQSDSLGGEVE